MSNVHKEFPYEELRDENGDYFTSRVCCLEAGIPSENIWSVVESDCVIEHGPAHHYVNVLGFVGTVELNDGQYYSIDVSID